VATKFNEAHLCALAQGADTNADVFVRDERLDRVGSYLNIGGLSSR
jgi:hypothetical protein